MAAGLDEQSPEATRRVFSYVVAKDSGFAPNPFHGMCTLACCKPKTRKSAKVGDLVVGLTSRCERIMYMMEVTEKVDFATYWRDPRFRRKRPDWSSSDARERRGDNIYEPLPVGGFRQLRSNHWDHEADAEHEGNKRKDTGADAVLVGENFVYFGASGPALPDPLGFLRVARGHRCNFTPEQVQEVERYFFAAPRGLQGHPAIWSQRSTSQTGRDRCG